MDNKDVIKQGILEALKDGNELFPDIEEYLDSKGIDYSGSVAICYSKNPNIIMWAGWNIEAQQALSELLKEENVGIVYGTDYFCLMYMVIGKMLKFPIARSMNYHYKKDHWMPCALRFTV